MAQIIIDIKAYEASNGGTETDVHIKVLADTDDILSGEIARRITEVYKGAMETSISCALKSIRNDIENSKNK